MLKDFSQPFTRTPSQVFLIIEDAKTHDFLISTPDDEDPYYNEDMHSPLSLRVDANGDTALKMAEFLHTFGLSIISFRELNRTSNVEFSLADNTPGTLRDTVCLHVCVDVVKNQNNLVAASLQDVTEKLKSFGNDEVSAGLTQLQLERTQK
jgi:hypothetical protein